MAEKEYFSGKLLQVKDNMSKTWAILNSMTNKNRGKQIISRVEKNGVEINNPKEIAEEFNNFFVNIGSELAKKVPLGMSKPLDFLKNIDYYWIYVSCTNSNRRNIGYYIKSEKLFKFRSW